ncbi:MAG: YihY/virulence factor BrkB family protein [Chitinispirillia bacterium]|nr:YihY/virulence factor BrkB family protein [Chitinispirillia bacterium]
MKLKILKDIFSDPSLAVEKACRSKNKPLYIIVRTAVFLRILFSEYKRNHCTSRASGLAFILLITLIPLITTAALMFASITDVHPEHVESVISIFLPFAPPDIMEHIITFFINAQNLRGIGIGVLIIMTMSLFNTMEQSMNAIWKVERARSFFTRLRTFTMIIVYGPFLFFASFQLRHSGIFGIVLQDIFILRILPFALTVLAFILMFKFIPNTKVKIRSALLGGIVASLLFELERRLFGYYVHFSAQTHTIYGAVGFLPFFLISLYFTALLFLLGAQVAYVHQSFKPLLRSSRRWDRRVGDHRNYITLRIVIDCAAAFMKKQPPPNLDYFCEKYDITNAQAAWILNWLVQENFLHQTHKTKQYVPARDFSAVSLRSVFSAIIDQQCCIPFNPQDPAKEYLSIFMKEYNSHSHADDMTISEFIEQVDAGSEIAAASVQCTA